MQPSTANFSRVCLVHLGVEKLHHFFRQLYIGRGPSHNACISTSGDGTLKKCLNIDFVKRVYTARIFHGVVSVLMKCLNLEISNSNL